MKELKISVLKTIHFTLSLLLFFIFWIHFRYDSFSFSFQTDIAFRYNLFVLAGYAVVLFFLSRTYNSYLLGYTRIRSLVLTEAFSQFFAAGLIYVFVSVGWNQWKSPVSFIAMLAAQILLDIWWALLGNTYYFKLYPAKKTILIYRNEIDKKRFGSIRGKPTERLYSITRELQYTGDDFSEIRSEVEPFEAVFVAGINSRCRNGLLKYCQEKNIPGFFLPHVGDVIMQGAQHIQTFESPVLFISRKQVKPEFRISKRCMDLIVSLLGIVLLSPVMLMIALAIRLYDGGPALFHQTRLTRNGKRFRIHKFRSMRVDAEKDGVARLSTGDKDDRITPVGRLIRRYRLDEIPQLFNILTGDMSLVGPRPERPEIAEKYYQTMPDFRLRLQVKAGLTGYAQIYGRYNTSPYEKLEFDLLYINNMNFLTDLELIFATLTTLFSKESTQGVEVVLENQNSKGE